MSLIKFPQKCLLRDRKFTYDAAFNRAYKELLEYQREDTKDILQHESIEGAKKFISGIGKHGKTYNLTERPRKHWESE